MHEDRVCTMIGCARWGLEPANTAQRQRQGERHTQGERDTQKAKAPNSDSPDQKSENQICAPQPEILETWTHSVAKSAQF